MIYNQRMSNDDNSSLLNVLIGIIVLAALIAIFFLLSNSSIENPVEVESTPTIVPTVLPTATPTPAESIHGGETTGDTDESVEDASEKDIADEEEITPGAVVFDLVGVNFAFSKETLTVPQGAVVTINFRSEDGFHDFVIDEFDAATEQVNPGVETSVTFTASEAGEFEYYCSVGSHREMGMVGTLTVEPVE